MYTIPLPPRGRPFGEGDVMSNMNDAVGLRVPYGKISSQYQTEFEPGSGTIWGYFNPRGTACFSLGLLKDIRTHDSALAVNGGNVEVEGEQCPVHYYVCGSAGAPGVHTLVARRLVV